MAKVTILIRLISTAGTGHFYTTTVNPRNRTDSKAKLKLMKYDPVARKRVLYEEAKIK